MSPFLRYYKNKWLWIAALPIILYFLKWFLWLCFIAVAFVPPHVGKAACEVSEMWPCSMYRQWQYRKEFEEQDRAINAAWEEIYRDGNIYESFREQDLRSKLVTRDALNFRIGENIVYKGDIWLSYEDGLPRFHQARMAFHSTSGHWVLVASNAVSDDMATKCGEDDCEFAYTSEDVKGWVLSPWCVGEGTVALNPPCFVCNSVNALSGECAEPSGSYDLRLDILNPERPLPLRL